MPKINANNSNNLKFTGLETKKSKASMSNGQKSALKKASFESLKLLNKQAGYRTERFEIVGAKTKGVEPGYRAKKVITEADRKKIFENQDHKFYKEAQRFTDQQVSDGNPEPTKEQIESHIKKTFLKFQKQHFVKQDYAPAKKETEAIGSKGRTVKRRDANYAVVKEALAQELYDVLGMGGQKLRVLKSEYDDNGSAKLLLDGTEVRGEQGESFETLEGKLDNGTLTLDKRVENLGSYKAIAYVLGDWDKVGFAGANIGVTEENGNYVLQNIDPGHAFDESGDAMQDIMGTFALNDDFSIDDSKHVSPLGRALNGLTRLLLKKEAVGFKNFSIFDAAPLSEKMSSVRTFSSPEINLAIEKLFQKFEDQFSEGELDFKAELAQDKNKLMKRIGQLNEAFAERMKLSDEELDIADGIEKLVSQATLVRSKYPIPYIKVTKRKAVTVRQESNATVFSFKDKSGRSSKTLTKYLSKMNVKFEKVNRGVFRIDKEELKNAQKQCSLQSIKKLRFKK